MPLSLTERFSLKRFKQGSPARNASVMLNHRRVFILPNRAGFTLAAVIIFMLVASINYSNSMGFVFTFLLASATQVSTFFSFRNLSGIEVHGLKCAPCFLGQNTSASFIIKETEGRDRWGIVATIDGQQLSIAHLKPHQSYPINLPVLPSQRGWYSPNTLTLSSVFPFAVFRAWSPLLFAQKLLVYPRPLSFNQAIPSLPAALTNSSITSPSTGADDFSGFKTYQPGDPYRQINWKAWAAEKGLFSKQFSSQQSAQVWLDWHACSSANTEAKLSELCQWALTAEKAQLRYGLRLPSKLIPPANGDAHLQHCLQTLALFNLPADA